MDGLLVALPEGATVATYADGAPFLVILGGALTFVEGSAGVLLVIVGLATLLASNKVDDEEAGCSTAWLS